MIIYPAIDLKEGECVRLVQGRAENKTVYSRQLAQVALQYEQEGAEWLHVVDLDGAFSGSPKNLEAIKAIAGAVSIPFQVGGGLRTAEDIDRLLKAGAARVIIGTRAVQNPEFISDMIQQFGAEKIVLGIDARDGMVAVEGWVTTSELDAVEFGKQMRELGVIRAVFTDIARDGLLSGPNFERTKEMAEKTGLRIIASGGVSTVENIYHLKSMQSIGVSGAIIGKAIYDGKITLAQALEASQ